MLLNPLATRSANALMDFSIGLLLRCHPEWIPRIWSNNEIKRIGEVFSGDVLNVSGWKDGDKDGDRYVNYFPKARSYTVSNFGAELGASGGEEIEIDLSQPIPSEMSTFELVFSHTVIEHVHPPSVVFKNLCSLSHDSIITIVPFMQPFHGVEGRYTDYYRYSPLALEKRFAEYGFQTVYVSWNHDHPLMNVYIFHLASKNPERFVSLDLKSQELKHNDAGPGVSWTQFLWPNDSQRSFWRKFGDFMGGIARRR